MKYKIKFKGNIPCTVPGIGPLKKGDIIEVDERVFHDLKRDPMFEAISDIETDEKDIQEPAKIEEKDEDTPDIPGNDKKQKNRR